MFAGLDLAKVAHGLAGKCCQLSPHRLYSVNRPTQATWRARRLKLLRRQSYLLHIWDNFIFVNYCLLGRPRLNKQYFARDVSFFTSALA